MNSQKTLYISDLDGTLLNNSALLPETAKQTLNTLIARGMHFSIATARKLNSTQKTLEGLNLRLPVALMNGALLYDVERQRYARVNTIEPATVTEIIKILRRFEVTCFMHQLKDDMMFTYHESAKSQPMREITRQRIARYSSSATHTEGFDSVSAENTIYFSLLDTYARLLPTYESLSQLSNLKSAFYEDTYNPGLWYLEVFSSNASKQNAVEYLRETYKFEQVVGFGDNLNDLPMFSACDVCIAVENAKPEVKSSANFICGTNDDNGVARWLEENVL